MPIDQMTLIPWIDPPPLLLPQHISPAFNPSLPLHYLPLSLLTPSLLTPSPPHSLPSTLPPPSLPPSEGTHQFSDGGLCDGNGDIAVDGFSVCKICEEVQNVTGVHVGIHDGWPGGEGGEEEERVYKQNFITEETHVHVDRQSG